MTCNEQTLCDTCARMTLTLPVQEQLLRTYENVQELEKSASRGCDFCKLIKLSHDKKHASEEIDDLYGSSPDEELEHYEFRVFHQMHPRTDMESNIHWTCRQSYPTFARSTSGMLGGFYAEHDSPASKYFPGRPLKSSTSYHDDFRLIKHWLDQCDSQHPACTTNSFVHLPTRVIAVNGSTSADEACLHITEAQDCGAYAALSYCWGKSKHVVLKKDTIQQMCAGIQLSLLPRTIRETVLATRELGISYLWIDALCIIQDSPEDWQLESARMGQVYSNARITIAASGSDDSDGGLLVRNPLQQISPVKLSFQSAEGDVGAVSVRFEQIWERNVRNPIDKRAWTLQEYLLSPRLTSFGSRQLSWECKTTRLDEVGSVVSQQDFGVGLPKPIRLPYRQAERFSQVEGTSKAQAAHRTWQYIITDFSERSLTYAADALPALSGLAHYISSTRPDDAYCAGLWRNDMPMNLMWSLLGTGVTRRSERGPSWSWVSFEASHHLSAKYFDPAKYCCQIVDVSITPRGSDKYGQVTAGALVLESKIKSCWHVLDRISREQGSAGNVQQLYDRPFVPISEDELMKDRFGSCDLDVVDDSQPMDTPQQTWLCLMTLTDGLMLRKLQDGRFQRQGLFRLSPSKIDWFDECERTVITIV